MHTLDPEKLSPSARQVFKLIEFDKDEKLLFELRKHWFGLFIIYLFGTFVTVTVLVIAVASALATQNESFSSSGLSSLAMPVIVLCFFLAVLSLVITAIAAYLYRTNVILVTTDKLAQLLNVTIFNRKISQLSIGDVQDVTVKQVGIFAHAYNYGTLVIETAGEQQNYNFTFAPDPYNAAKAIVNAHEENLKQYGN